MGTNQQETAAIANATLAVNQKGAFAKQRQDQEFIIYRSTVNTIL